MCVLHKVNLERHAMFARERRGKGRVGCETHAEPDTLTRFNTACHPHPCKHRLFQAADVRFLAVGW